MSADDPDMPQPGGGDTAGPFAPEVAALIERCQRIAEREAAAEEAADEAGTEAPPIPAEDVRALLDLAEHPDALRACFPPVTLADLIPTADDLRAWGLLPAEHVTKPAAPEAARLGDRACPTGETGPGNRDMPPPPDPGGGA